MSLTGDDDAARVRHVEPGDEIEQRGLAGARLAHDGDVLAGGELQRHVVRARRAARAPAKDLLTLSTASMPRGQNPTVRPRFAEYCRNKSDFAGCGRSHPPTETQKMSLSESSTVTNARRSQPHAEAIRDRHPQAAAERERELGLIVETRPGPG